MTKSKGYTCPYCKGRVLKDDSVQEGRRYFHSECYEKKLDEEKEQRRHADDYKSLIDYICNLYGISAPTGMILKQVKDFQSEYGFKLKGMELALRYFHETLGNPVRDGDGIGIIIYVYEEAKKHFVTKLKVEESLTNFNSNVEKMIVEVASPQSDYRKKVTQIDISSL